MATEFHVTITGGVNDRLQSSWLGFSAIGRKDKKGRQYFLR